jgi:hypothetical protein
MLANVDLQEVNLGQPESYAYKGVIDEICTLGWSRLTEAELTGVAGAYYYFSIQFRENLEIACNLYPTDPLLTQLAQEECNTDNLSPWPGVASPGEKLDHDEFMRRLLKLSPVCRATQHVVEEAGQAYLSRIRSIDATTRASSIASYEDGGLEKVFRSILGCHHWNTPLLQAFRYFLVQHIAFDNNPNNGHGALARHLQLNDGLPLVWKEFKQLLTKTVPALW